MSSPGAPPSPPPGSGTQVGLRVLFVGIALFSCGLLCWVPLLRLAIVRKKAVDWVLWPVVLIAGVTLLMLFGQEEDIDSTRADLTFGGLWVLAFGASIHYLVSDIRHHRAAAYRSTSAPYARTYPSAQPQAPYNPYRDAPAPVPVPAPAPAPAVPPQRLDQVRAELDELSDYLRRQEGR